MERNTKDDGINEAFESGLEEHSETVDITGEVVDDEEPLDSMIDLRGEGEMPYDPENEAKPSTDILEFETYEGVGLFGHLEELFQGYGFRNEDSREVSDGGFMEIYTHPEVSGNVVVYDEGDQVRTEYQDENGEVRETAVLNDPLEDGWETQVSTVLDEAIPGSEDSYPN